MTPTPILFRLNGATFRPAECQTIVAALQPGNFLTLEPEPSNPYDPNAVKIIFGLGAHIGYVSKEACEDVLAVIASDSPNLECRVVSKIGLKSALCELRVLDA